MKKSYAQKSSTVQKAAAPNAASVLDSSAQNESLQRKADMANNAAQRAEAPRPNNTGMPDNLKSGIESLSGFSMDNVRVHYNSSKPATVQALAYTQGTDIHVAPGQEKCLPHEAWHVAQQMAGRVSPTTNINGMPVNDNAALEHEADVMGEKAVQCKSGMKTLKLAGVFSKTVQCETTHIFLQGFKETLPVCASSEIYAAEDHKSGTLPHIAFETLAGGSRIDELGNLYNEVIKNYQGAASVYMGVNACRYIYDNDRKDAATVHSVDSEAASKVQDYVRKVKADIANNKKPNHSITLIPFLWDPVGLGKKVDKKDENKDDEKKSEDEKPVGPKTEKKGKKSKKKGKPKEEKAEKEKAKDLPVDAGWEEERMPFEIHKDESLIGSYKNPAAYDFPFYEARSMLMTEAAQSKADLYRWMDSDVRNDTSIDVINKKGKSIFGSGVSSDSDARVWSGFYAWRKNDDDESKLPPQLDMLNQFEKKWRTLYWKWYAKKKPEKKYSSFFGYIPEPIAYMNTNAHSVAITNLSGDTKDGVKGIIGSNGKQDGESKIAFGGTVHEFVDSFSVTKPRKHYFDRFVTESSFRESLPNAHQSAYGWNTSGCLKGERNLLTRVVCEGLDSVLKELKISECKTPDCIKKMLGIGFPLYEIVAALKNNDEKIDNIISSLKTMEITDNDLLKLVLLKAGFEMNEINKALEIQNDCAGKEHCDTVDAEIIKKIVDSLSKERTIPEIITYLKHFGLDDDTISQVLPEEENAEEVKLVDSPEKKEIEKTDKAVESEYEGKSAIDIAIKLKKEKDYSPNMIAAALYERKFPLKNIMDALWKVEFALDCDVFPKTEHELKSFLKKNYSDFGKNEAFLDKCVKYLFFLGYRAAWVDDSFNEIEKNIDKNDPNIKKISESLNCRIYPNIIFLQKKIARALFGIAKKSTPVLTANTKLTGQGKLTSAVPKDVQEVLLFFKKKYQNNLPEFVKIALLDVGLLDVATSIEKNK